VATDFDWVDRATAQQILGIKEAQLRNDTAVLLQLETPGFDYRPYSDRGYGKSSLEVLKAFRLLVRTKGRTRAIEEINSSMEKMYERERQASSRKR